MSAVPISLGAHKRSLSPEAILLNAYVENAPTQQEKSVAIRARAGTTAFQTVGSAPLRGLFQRNGLFGNSAIVIADTSVYLLDALGVATALSGTLAGSGVPDIDASQDADLISVARVATGTSLYKITEADGVVLDNLPDGTGASSICCLRGFWIAVENGTDQVFVQVPGDTDWDAITFVSAEYSPDPVKAVRVLGEQVWLLGGATSEPWTLSATASPPLEPYGGMVYNFGCRASAAAVSLPGAVIWVDDTCRVQMTEGGAPTVISDAGLSEQIASVDDTDLQASWYLKQGALFYKLKLGTLSTWAYNVTLRQWSRDSAEGYDYSRISLFAQLGDVVLAGNTGTNQIYKVDPDARDDDGNTFPVEFTAFAEVLEGSVPCANLELICEVGDAPRTGQGSDPVIQMRYSDDNEKTWSRWRERPLGATGESRVRVRWNGLGTIRAPYGRVFHFRVSDPVGRRFSDVRMNVS